MLIDRQNRGVEDFVGGVKDSGKTVRCGLVGSEQSKVAGIGIQPEHVAQVTAENSRGLSRADAVFFEFDRVIPEGRQFESLQQQAAVSMWIGAHAPVAFRGDLRELRAKLTALLEQLF